MRTFLIAVLTFYWLTTIRVAAHNLGQGKDALDPLDMTIMGLMLLASLFLEDKKK